MSSLNFSKKIALRYLWSKRSEAFISIITVISILGVVIGVTVLTMTMAIMTGFEEELRKKIVGSAHIQVQKLGGKISRWSEVSESISSIDGVVSVAAFTYHQALISTGRSSRGILIRGIEKESSAARELDRYLEGSERLGSLFKPAVVSLVNAQGEGDQAELPTLIIGRELSRKLALFVDDTVSLLSPQVSSSPFGLVPRYKRFVVADSYKSGMVGYEEALAYMSLKNAQKFFRMGDSVSALEVMVSDIDAAPQIAQQIRIHLNREFGAGFIAEDWTERNKELWEAIALEKQAYFIVLLLLIVLASFSIISTLIMIVLEKRRDIAIMKTLGASTRSIANIFRMQGAVIGSIGTVLGVLGGYFGSVALREYGFKLPENVFPTATVPVKLELINFVVVAIAAFVICLVSTIYPARRASRLAPSEVLRYE